MDWHWDNSYLNCLVRERCALHHSHLESREKMLEIIKLMLSYDSQIVTTLKTKNNLHKNVFNLATEAADFTLIKILQDASKQ
jgi:hypothetical protein